MKKIKGQSLFEVVVALAISALVIVALVSLVSSSIRNANFSRNKSQASTYAQEASEWLRNQRDSDSSSFFVHILTSNWCLNNLNWNTPGSCVQGSSISGTIFKRNVTFNSNLISGKTVVEAEIIVEWSDAQGLHKVQNSTNLSDWRER